MADFLSSSGPEPIGVFMKVSARNLLSGTITRIVRGPVSTEVTLHIVQGVEIVSVITSQSARRLKLKRGQKAHALIKADSVILAVD
jgi:molybdopterin-binding protein